MSTPSKLAPTLVGGTERVWRSSYAIAIGVTQNSEGKVQFPTSKSAREFAQELAKELGSPLEELAKPWEEFTGKAGELLEITVNHRKIKRLYFVGMGSADLEGHRKAAIALARKCKSLEKTITHAIELNQKFATAHFTSLILASYLWNQKSKPNPKPARFIVIGNYESALSRAQILGGAVWRARDMVHTPSNIKTPLWMANQAKSFVAAAKNPALSITVKAGKELKDFGGLLAVGGSSPKPGPRFIELSYAPRGSKNWPHIVLVGKGITFDTGGLSLKRPYDTMMAMKSDMTGAAVVMSTVLAVAELAPKVRVTALMMCAENSVSSTSQRPSDVIKHYGGTTVEVLNTDAEGRLVLADGLAYADAHLEPDYLIDVATLTGSATLALGRQFAAMYTRDLKLAASLHAIGDEVGERVWHMPLVDDYIPALESDIADINHTADKYDFSAGSITAALFLEEFVGKRKWVHFDIAGPARSESDSGENPKGGTAFGVRVLTEWIASKG